MNFKCLYVGFFFFFPVLCKMGFNQFYNKKLFCFVLRWKCFLFSGTAVELFPERLSPSVLRNQLSDTGPVPKLQGLYGLSFPATEGLISQEDGTTGGLGNLLNPN